MPRPKRSKEYQREQAAIARTVHLARKSGMPHAKERVERAGKVAAESAAYARDLYRQKLKDQG